MNRIEEEYKITLAKAKEKYSSLLFKGSEFYFENYQIQVHSRFYDEFLKINEEEIMEQLKSFCKGLIQTFIYFAQQYQLTNIRIFGDEEFKRPFRNPIFFEEEKREWKCIFIPSEILSKKFQSIWNFALLHELSHWWWIPINHRFIKTAYEELFADHFAAITLEKFFFPDSDEYKYAIKICPYQTGEQNRKRFLENPKESLKYWLELLKGFR